MEDSKGIISSRNATVKVILFTSKTLANGEHPIMLKITKNRLRKYIGLGINCSLKYWNKEKELPKPNHPKRTEIVSLINRFEKEFTDKIQEFSLQQKDYTTALLADTVLKKSKSAVVAEFVDALCSSQTLISVVPNLSRSESANKPGKP